MAEIEYPTLVYKTPGPHEREGHSYQYRGCADAEEMAYLEADGWHPTFDEAVLGRVIQRVQDADDAIDEISPATREELEAKATELKISFNGRTSDKVLAQRIADAV